MNADCARGTSDFTRSKFHSVSDGIDWKTAVGLFVITVLCSIVGATCHSLLVPGEARHAGIVHDMWAARQYLMPRVEGLPVLDGAPLHYWLSLGFLGLFGAAEWVLRLPAAISAALTLVVMARVWLPWLPARSTVTLAILFLIQPALALASRFASPDMLNILLLTVSVSAFLQAVARLEQGEPASSWALAAWVATGLLGLGAGPLASAVPLVIVILWLTLRRRCGLVRALCWWPGPLAVAALLMPWLYFADAQYPGVVAVMVEKQLFSLIGRGREGWMEGYGLYGLLMVGGLLPLATCLYRCRNPDRLRAARTPVAGLMAVWLAVLVPLHPLVAMTAVGSVAMITVPLIYFGVLALGPGPQGRGGARGGAWLLHAALLGAAVVAAGAPLVAYRASDLPPLAQTLAKHYRGTTDKVVLLDRFDYELNFYMRSPKLVYVVADWSAAAGSVMPSWKAELIGSARFAPDTARRLLLEHDAFMEKLCERRVVNLWVVGSPQAYERHPILLELDVLGGPHGELLWYLGAGTELAQCATWSGG